MSSETHIRQPLPATVVIIGAGIFGLSTALSIAKRYPSTSVTVIDRLKPPVIGGSSVDATRCIRSGELLFYSVLRDEDQAARGGDYADPIYARPAKEAQAKIENDSDLNRHMFQQGMTFVCDGEPSRFTDLWKTQKDLARASHRLQDTVEMPSRHAVFESFHGERARPPENDALIGGKSRWNIAYCNLKNAFIDAHACMQPSVSFQCGSAVERILVKGGIAEGVVLENGGVLLADLVVVAAGAWSNRLVYLDQRVYPIAHEVAWIRVNPYEEQCWQYMAITTNLSTGLNIFPPQNGEIKILRRSPGYKNTMHFTHPEDPSKVIQISHPRTIVTHPTDVIPLNAEKGLRENLKEIMPTLADWPFDRTKLCWISTTPTADFLVAPHPRIAGIHLATGGSAHAWKFLPVIGDLVVDSIEGALSPELTEKWAYERSREDQDQNAPRMDGDPQELRDVVRSHI